MTFADFLKGEREKKDPPPSSVPIISTDTYLKCQAPLLKKALDHVIQLPGHLPPRLAERVPPPIL